MHPPFGFALFYLRGISDTLYKNGSLPRKVESRDIYLGAIPWVLMQLLLVAIVIFVPQSVTVFLDKPQELDLNKATEQLMQMGGSEQRGARDAADDMKLFETSPAASAPGGGAAAADDPTDIVRRAIEDAARKP